MLSFPFPLRFLFASKPEAIGPVLAIVHRVIAGWLADQAGVERTRAQCGAVTLIQRFGSALNLNVHFHMLWLDGVYEEDDESPPRKPRLHRARAPTCVVHPWSNLETRAGIFKIDGAQAAVRYLVNPKGVLVYCGASSALTVLR